MLAALIPRPDLAPVGQAELAAAQRFLSAECASRQSSIANRQSAWDSPMEARIPGRFVVGFEPGEEEAACAWVDRQGGSVTRVDEASGFVVADFPQGCESHEGRLAQSASLAGGIRYFEPAVRVTAAGLPNDPYFIPDQWDKWAMYADEAWDVTGGSMDVKVAVVDNGVDWQHPDLAADFKTGELGYDFIGNDNDPRPDNFGVPQSFHGTHVAGIIAASRNNNEGVAGWSLVQLLAVRVLNDTGKGTTDVVASGIRWATDHGARVINMSLVSEYSSSPMEAACKYAAEVGVLLVAASGNEGADAVGYPAALSECIAVGATSMDSRLASFSNYGSEQELAAPGADIISCVPGGAYGHADGTSMASPQVAGVASLVLARNPGLSAAETRAILAASAMDMGAVGRDIQYGYGLVNAKRAVDLAAVYVARRASGGLSPNGDCPHVAGTVIVRARTGLPVWVKRARIYDGSGRLVQVTGSGLSPGTYFVPAHSSVLHPHSSSYPSPLRLLVLD